MELHGFRFDVNSGNEHIKPAEGNVFVTVTVAFFNKSGDTQHASPGDFKLRSAGVEHNVQAIGSCEMWSPAKVAAGASYGPKCLAFQAKAGERTGNVLIWTSGRGPIYYVPVS